MTTSSSGSLIPTSPIVNLGNLYITGAVLTWLTGTTMTVGAGQVRDSTDTTDIIVGGNLVSSTSNPGGGQGTNNPVTGSSAVTINAAIVGAGGIDAGALAASTNYAVYVIGDSLGFKNGSAILSTNFTRPSLPLGYNCFRQVGSVLTSGASAILDFSSITFNSTVNYAAAIATAVTAGNATSFTPIVLTTFIPGNATGVYLKVVLTSDAGGTRTAAFRATGSTSAAGQAIVSSPASTVTTEVVLVPVTNTAGVMSVDYLVSNSSAAVAVSVAGYVAQL